MLAKDILKIKAEKGTNQIHTIVEDSSAYDAVALCDEKRIGSLMVINHQKEVTGIVTEKDILYKCYKGNIALKDRVIKELMTSINDIIIGKEDDRAEYFRNVMTNRRIRHIPIFNKDNMLVGIISSGDIIKAELESHQTEIKMLREHIQNPYGIHVYKE